MPEPTSSSDNTVREVVAVFHDADKLEAAAHALMQAGVPERRMSLLGDKEAVAKRLGHRLEPLEIMEDDPRVPQRAFVFKEDRQAAETIAIGLPLYIGAMGGALTLVASGGTLAMALLGALGGGVMGGGLGGVIAGLIGKTHAARLEQNLREGGILFWVFVANAAEGRQVSDILKKSGGTDVHVHQIERTWGEEKIPFEDWIKDWNPDPFLD